MKNTAIILFVFSVFQSLTYAAFGDWQTGCRAKGMAGAYTGVAEGLDAIRWNPAGLAGLAGWQAQANVGDRTGISGPLNTTASLGKNMGRWGGMALAIQLTGSEPEYDQSFVFAHGFCMTDQFSFGYDLNLYRRGTGYSAGVDVGLLARVHCKWRFGCFGHNLNHPSFGAETPYELPSSIAVGLACQSLPGWTGSAEAGKEPGHTACYKIGTEWAVKQNVLNLRGGLSSQGRVTLYSLGTDITASGLTFGYTYEGGHQELSGNHQLGLAYKWGAK